MIDVPGAVKRALQDGRLLKNYKIEVYHIEPYWQEVYVYTEEGDPSFTVDVDGLYKFVSDNTFVGSKIDEQSTQTYYTPELIDGHYETEPFAAVSEDFLYISEHLNDDNVYLYRYVYDENNIVSDFTLDNNNIVSESVKYDERMCSGEELRYGLCEGASIEFQYFGQGNIAGKSVKVSVSIQYKDTDGVLKWHDIPIGYFDIDKCSREAATGIYKATGYNKLMSGYLDALANNRLTNEIYFVYERAREHANDVNVTTLDMITYDLLKGFSAVSEFKAVPGSNYYYMRVSPWVDSSTYPGALYYTDSAYLRIAEPECRTTIRLADPNNLPTEGGLFRFYINLDKYYDLLLDIMTYLGVEDIEVKGSIEESDTTPLKDYVYANGSKISAEIKMWNNFDYLGYDIEGISIYFNTMTGEIYSQAEPKIFTGYEVEINHPACYMQYDGSIPLKNAWTLLDPDDKAAIIAKWEEFFTDPECFRIEDTDQGTAGATILTQSQIEELEDCTLREIQSSILELNCQYGQMSRIDNKFYAKDLNSLRLYPAETLYPDNELYPGGSSLSPHPSTYSKLWADEGNVHNWRYLIINYKTIDGNNQEVEATLQRTVNGNGTDDYIISDNWLFKNFTWTAEQVGLLADAMVDKMQNITWFPFEMWLPGLPYMETGDEIEISIGGSTYTSYILQRQLDGLQNLQDTYIDGSLDIF